MTLRPLFNLLLVLCFAAWPRLTAAQADTADAADAADAASDDTAASPQAEAEAPEYDEETIEAVNTHFAAGARLYYDGKYDEAIAEFEAAHAKIPNAIFLYNISLAQAKKGQLQESLETAKQAEAFGGLAANERVANQGRIAALERVFATERASVDIANRPRIEEPLLKFSVFGWTGSALVVAGFIGLAGVGIIDRNLSEDVERYKAAGAAGDRATYEELDDDIRPRQRAGRVLFALSSVAIVSGAGLLVYDLFFREREVAVVPTVGTPGVAIIGRF